MKSFLTFVAFVLALVASPRVWAQSGETPVKAGEALRISILSVPQPDIAAFASTSFAVSDKGTVNLPHIGEVRALGMTPSTLSRAIEQAYKSAQIYTKPSINISRDASGPGLNQQTVTVSGNVRQPGGALWKPDMLLIEAISERGGPDDFADMRRVRIVRAGREVGTYDLRRVDDPKNNVKLQPRDVVMVPKSRF